MIHGFSKFAVLYLAPVLMLTALFLSLLAFLAPSVMLHDQVALLTVIPSTVLTNPQAQANDGPSLFLGALGSFIIYTALMLNVLIPFCRFVLASQQCWRCQLHGHFHFASVWYVGVTFSLIFLL